eukprot:2704428-Rhodomonas_salina.1
MALAKIHWQQVADLVPQLSDTKRRLSRCRGPLRRIPIPGTYPHTKGTSHCDPVPLLCSFTCAGRFIMHGRTGVLNVW